MFPISYWGFILILGCLEDFFPNWLTTWPGFIASICFWYTQEYCYYLVLLHWTLLEYSFARWIFRNFQSKFHEDGYQSCITKVGGAGGKMTKRISIGSHQKCHKRGKLVYKISMTATFIIALIANILIVAVA